MNASVARVSSAADLDAIIEIEAASFHNPTTRAWYESELQRPDVCFVYVVRTTAHDVAGFCAFWKVVDQIHIDNLAIRHELRRQWLGQFLLRRVLEDAAAMGAPHATLEVRRSNTAARYLYERAGFTSAGVRTGYYTNPIEDALILARSTS